MTRSDLIAALAAKHDLTGYIAEQIVLEVFSSMTEALVANDRIEIRGFVSIANRKYVGRTGRNPKTGEEVSVKSKLRPHLKVGKELEARIMSGANS